MKGDGTKLEHSHSAKKSLKCFSEKMSACIQCCHEDGTLERAAANLPRSHCDTLPVAHIIVTSAGPEPTVHAFFYYSSGVISRFAERTKKKKKKKRKVTHVELFTDRLEPRSANKHTVWPLFLNTPEFSTSINLSHASEINFNTFC